MNHETLLHTRIALCAHGSRLVARTEHRLRRDRDHRFSSAKGLFHDQSAGPGSGSRNRCGPAVSDERNRERISTSLGWLESVVTRSGFLPEVLSVQDIVFACFILWTESGGPIEWHGRPKLEALVTRLENRPSFRETAPQPWRPHPL